MGCKFDVHMRSTTHTFVAFMDSHQVVDTSWVEAALVELLIWFNFSSVFIVFVSFPL